MNYVPLLFRFLIGFCRLNWEKYRILKFICQQSFSTMHWLDGGLIGRDVEKITAISRVNGRKMDQFLSRSHNWTLFSSSINVLSRIRKQQKLKGCRLM